MEKLVLELNDIKVSFLDKTIFTEIDQLSGGESIRLKLCQLFLGACNVLILDEPENFLDLRSRKALESLLLNYEGTVLMVSHDRAFINRTADQVYEIQEKKVKLIHEYKKQ
ncbi:ATP-binding cassette domain-containing protein [Alkalicoccus halolimnae]|uniref:ATP-binding cassette domain-containing protein n=1 Tax=Alkalicoccus halolimnae TaxID=1667239 RepID=A0A5C7F3P5_9BACI|nr:ATP-binding cassette domain-containing protein [Alkalicoccus halolimnae]TXF85281.1 ATP-binding cassette domain-containing protein [Alkalicoccus halolimnae]